MHAGAYNALIVIVELVVHVDRRHHVAIDAELNAAEFAVYLSASRRHRSVRQRINTRGVVLALRELLAVLKLAILIPLGVFLAFYGFGVVDRRLKPPPRTAQARTGEKGAR
jgi:hypothetical protein